VWVDRLLASHCRGQQRSCDDQSGSIVRVLRMVVPFWGDFRREASVINERAVRRVPVPRVAIRQTLWRHYARRGEEEIRDEL
jgi:hypothetical protein